MNDVDSRKTCKVDNISWKRDQPTLKNINVFLFEVKVRTHNFAQLRIIHDKADDLQEGTRSIIYKKLKIKVPGHSKLCLEIENRQC